jgi:hypothetical protein
MDEDEVLTLSSSDLLMAVDDVDISTNDQTLRVSKVSDAVNGIAELDGNGNVIFKPNKDFNGLATFTYWVSDSEGASVAAQAKWCVQSMMFLHQDH